MLFLTRGREHTLISMRGKGGGSVHLNSVKSLTQTGVHSALEHRAGLSAQIVDGGMLRVGDQLELVLEASE